MPIVNRRVTYKLYPDAKQHAALERLCDLHRGLYNAALENGSTPTKKPAHR